MNARVVRLVLLGLAATAVLTVIHTGLGTQPLTPGEVLRAMLGSPDVAYHRVLVADLRIPRGLVAVAAGAMLAVAGALLQAAVRNPLADPALIGLTGGGVLAAVVILSSVPGLAVSRWLPTVILVGCLLTGALVLLLSRTRGVIDPKLLVLTGIVTGGIATSVASVLLLRSQQALGSILPWMIGSLNGRVWQHWTAIWPWALVGLTVAFALARLANQLLLGDDQAIAAGVRPTTARVGIFGLAAVLTAASISVVGAIGFVGLMAPHLARRLVGADARRLLPVTAVIGGALLLGADVISQGMTIQPPFRADAQRVGVPTGAVTALLGAPLAIILLRRSQVYGT